MLYKEEIHMNETSRKPFTTNINDRLLKEIKKLAIDLDKGVNDLLEEGIEALLEKYHPVREVKRSKK
jgi:hypothetical protein